MKAATFVHGDRTDPRYKIVVHRTGGWLMVVSHSSRDMPDDGYTIIKGVTEMMAIAIMNQIYEYLQSHSVAVLMTLGDLVGGTIELQLIQIDVARGQNDEPLASNTAHVFSELMSAESATPVVQIIWPRANRTWETVLLVAAERVREVGSKA